MAIRDEETGLMSGFDRIDFPSGMTLTLYFAPSLPPDSYRIMRDPWEIAKFLYADARSLHFRPFGSSEPGPDKPHAHIARFRFCPILDNSHFMDSNGIRPLPGCGRASRTVPCVSEVGRSIGARAVRNGVTIPVRGLSGWVLSAESTGECVRFSAGPLRVIGPMASEPDDGAESGLCSAMHISVGNTPQTTTVKDPGPQRGLAPGRGALIGAKPRAHPVSPTPVLRIRQPGRCAARCWEELTVCEYSNRLFATLPDEPSGQQEP
jgi:hypothetical protein